MTRARALAAILVLAGLLAAGCAGLGDDGDGIALEKVADREPAPRFSVKALDGGGRVTLDGRSGRPVILNFWASWCEPCTEEMPEIVAFARAHPEVDVVGLAVNDAPSDSRRFAEGVGVQFPLGIDRDADVLAEFGGSGLPVTAIIDARGRIAAMAVGGVTEDDLDGVAADLG